MNNNTHKNLQHYDIRGILDRLYMIDMRRYLMVSLDIHNDHQQAHKHDQINHKLHRMVDELYRQWYVPHVQVFLINVCNRSMIPHLSH